MSDGDERGTSERPSEPEGAVAAEEKPAEDRPVLRVVTPDATPEEVAALVAVFQGIAAAAASQAPAPRKRARWSDPARMHRQPVHPSPGGWWASGLPR